MDSTCVTTPFGRRAMSFGVLATQFATQKNKKIEAVDKWKLYRSVCEARPLLGVTDRSLAVLNALLSFYPKNELSSEAGLVVFPSNAQLSLRAHGMAEQTLRRHLSALVEAGLIIRKDSPNGKRYARKHRGGEISEAYGFSLAPLLARKAEIEELAERIVSERLDLQRLRESISLCRRDIQKLCDMIAASGQVEAFEGFQTRYNAIARSLGRNSKPAELKEIGGFLASLRAEVTNYLENIEKSENLGGNDCQNERLIKNSESESISKRQDLHEPVTTAPASTVSAQPAYAAPISAKPSPPSPKPVLHKQFFVPDIVLVLKACPDITLYAPGGAVTGWRDLEVATSVIKTMFNISQSAYQDALATFGRQGTAAILACLLQKADQISSLGGYLRNLTRKAQEGGFDMQTMLLAQLRGRKDTMEASMPC
ncbi:replication initiation protein RepC [Agrobacterium tumefaciens]|uniref:plasmid replication protein RepC n=1 Tax=Agrobacterium tumefaciens TaxID=358 RepID=UPI000B3FEF14|nr:plasmid replication protein RepC [Agrobacterium tumefaciens]MBP2511436.1 replication initiation protein RepC [Agrobacterium tumefaciens]MBP2520681.1 replication initiation protein RepC [Agrobacterium tumefaciens]MBP2579350.1 replication initiation protein RepC [Agrobacterium tumefaciens]MBP2597672.1 replication initiation protein RepC [Agrobacterium tumefaciens]MCW8058766.1 replication initiation protein RepC [Agrobacterium tumefaciens]